MAKNKPTEDEAWRAHREEQLLAVASATPHERLMWLEEAVEFARRAGAIPGFEPTDESAPETPGSEN